MLDILTTAAEDGRTVLLISHTPVPDALVTRRLQLEDGRLAGLTFRQSGRASAFKRARQAAVRDAS